MKLIGPLMNTNEIDEVNVDAFVVGLNSFCVNLPSYNIEEIVVISKLLKEKKKELFVGINKNIGEDEIEELKSTLVELDKLDCAGIWFYDMALVQLKKESKIKTDLVWASEHMTTNVATMNMMYKQGVKYTYVSAELTMAELTEIVDMSKGKLVLPLFGYQSMFVSKRHLVNNYLETFSINNTSRNRYLSKEGRSYFITDDNTGTSVYSSYILNGLEEALKLDKKGNYVYLNSFNIPKEIYSTIVDIYKSTNKKNVKKNTEQIDKLLEGKTDKGFLYHETVYKVK